MDYHNGLDLNVPALLHTAKTAVIAFTDLPNSPSQGKEGGYLTIRDKKTGHVLTVLLIGRVPHEKAIKYCNLSKEKVAAYTPTSGLVKSISAAGKAGIPRTTFGAVQ